MPRLTQAQEQELARRQEEIQASIFDATRQEQAYKERMRQIAAEIAAIDVRIPELNAEQLRLAKEIKELNDYMSSWAKSFNLMANRMPLEITAEEIVTKANEELHDVDLRVKLYALESSLSVCVREQQDLRDKRQKLKNEADDPQARFDAELAKDLRVEYTRQLYAVQYEQRGDQIFEIFDGVVHTYLKDITEDEMNRELAWAENASVIAAKISSGKLELKHYRGLFSCWRMVNHARNVVYGEYKKDRSKLELLHANNRYLAQSKKIFTKLTECLPPEMQLLKVLYSIGDYDRINTIMVAYEQLLNHYKGDIPKQVYVEFIQAMFVAVTAANRQHAEATLARRIDVKTFPAAKDLIAQMEYLQRLRAFLFFEQYDINDPLRKELDALSNKLDENIRKAILPNRTLNNAAQDLEEINLELKSNDSELMRHLFIEKVEARLWQTAPVIPLAGLWLGGAIAAYVVGASAVESASMQSSKQSLEAQRLASKLDPIDFLFIHQVDKLMGVHTAAPVDERDITGETVATKAQSAGVKLIDNVVDHLMRDDGERGYISQKVANKLHKKVQPKISAASNFIAALFVMTAFNSLASMIALAIVFPTAVPIALATAGVSSLIGFAGWQLLAPGSTIPEKMMRVSTAITYRVALTFNYLLSPMRSLKDNVNERRILASMGSFMGSVLGTLASLVMLPLAIVPVFTATVLGFVSAIAPIKDAKGVERRRTFKEITDTIFSVPIHVVQRRNEVFAANKKMFVLTQAEINDLKRIVPQVHLERLMKLLEAYRSERFSSAQKQLQEIGNNYNPELIVQLANDVYRIESDCQVTEALLQTLIAIKDTEEAQPKIVEKLIQHIDQFLQQEFAEERKKYVTVCAARKEANAIEPQAPVKTKPGVMRFSSQDARVKAAEKILGTPPQFEMEYAVDYGKERIQIERIAEMHQLFNRLRPS